MLIWYTSFDLILLGPQVIFPITLYQLTTSLYLFLLFCLLLAIPPKTQSQNSHSPTVSHSLPSIYMYFLSFPHSRSFSFSKIISRFISTNVFSNLSPLSLSVSLSPSPHLAAITSPRLQPIIPKETIHSARMHTQGEVI